MERITYAGNTLVTGSAIAHAVLEYARALAEAGIADTVVIPTVAEDGAPERVEMLIGPASQLMSGSTRAHGPELEDEETVAELGRRTRGLISRPNTSDDHDDEPSSWSSLDDL